MDGGDQYFSLAHAPLRDEPGDASEPLAVLYFARDPEGGCGGLLTSSASRCGSGAAAHRRVRHGCAWRSHGHSPKDIDCSGRRRLVVLRQAHTAGNLS